MITQRPILVSSPELVYHGLGLWKQRQQLKFQRFVLTSNRARIYKEKNTWEFQQNWKTGSEPVFELAETNLSLALVFFVRTTVGHRNFAAKLQLGVKRDLRVRRDRLEGHQWNKRTRWKNFQRNFRIRKRNETNRKLFDQLKMKKTRRWRRNVRSSSFRNQNWNWLRKNEEKNVKWVKICGGNIEKNSVRRKITWGCVWRWCMCEKSGCEEKARWDRLGGCRKWETWVRTERVRVKAKSLKWELKRKRERERWEERATDQVWKEGLRPRECLLSLMGFDK